MPYGRRGGEFAVNKQLVGSQTTPSIAGFASGGFIVVWSTTDPLQDGAGRAIKAQRYDSTGNAIGPEILVNTLAAGDQRSPSVTTLPSGGYVITWETTDTTQDGSGTAIKGQLFDPAGAGVGAEFRVNSQLVADQTKSSVTGLEGGGFVVTWQTADPAQDGHTNAIKGQIYNAAGAAVGGEFLVNTGAVGVESLPSVTSLAGGGFVATWTLGAGTSADIYAQVFNSSGAKSGGQFRVNSTTPFNQDFSSVTELSDGRFVVSWASWSSLASGDTEIRARLFSASGAPIGNDFVVSTTKTNPNGGNFVFSSTPQVLDLPDGGFLVTWSHGSGDYISSSIRGQYFDSSGARVGTEFLVSTVSDRTESEPDIAIDGSGNLFAVWSSANSNFTDYDIRGQLYTPSGAPEIVSNGAGPYAAVTLAENQTAITTIVATDPEGSTLTFSIVGGLDASRFTIDAATGALSFVQARNFEVKQDFGANNVYDVIVSVSDGVNTDIQALAVAITNVNEGVTLTGGQPSYLYIENGTAPVADFNATDADGDPVAYSLSGADAARFTIDSNGVLRFAAPPNYEVRADAGANNIYDVVVTASDGSLPSSYALTVEVLNQNEAPYIVSGGGGDSFATTVAENAGFVMTIVTADPDATPSSVTYSIVGGADASKFFIAQNGQLFFSSARNFEVPTDVGANNVYDVIVSVSDGFNPADTQAIAVTVTNVNEAVTITSNGGGVSANVSVAENGLAVTTVTATDLDLTAPTYAIAGGADSALFTIDSTTGTLRFVAAPDFETPADSGGNNVYNVIVAASDGSLTDTQAIAVTVTGVNEDVSLAPSAAFSVGENESAVGTIVAADADGGPISYSIAGGADSALFAIDSATGALSFVSAPNFEAPDDAGRDNIYDVIVAAGDGLFSHTQAVTVTVGNANEGVTITSGGGGGSASLSVAENGVAVAAVAAVDADGTPVSYAITGGADSARFSIDAVTGVLSFLDAPDFEAPGDAGGDNVYEVTVSAGDGSFADSQAIAIAVINADEDIELNPLGAFSIDENMSAVGTIVASDPDGGPVLYSIAGGADSALFAIDAATGRLSFVSAPDFEAPGDSDGDNVYELVVAASDGVFAHTQVVTVTVGNANEGVTIASNGGGASARLSVAENGLAVATIAAVDADGTPVSYSISGGADSARFTIDSATGALTFVDSPDHETPGDSDGDHVYEIIVSASDGSFADTQALSVSVTNLDEDIAFDPLGAYSIGENMSAVGTVAASDPDGAAILYSIAGGADSDRFTIDPATGTLSFVSAPNFEAPADSGGDNVYELVVAASDGVFAHTQVVTVTVGDSNEGVTITSAGGGASAALNLTENGLAVAVVHAEDADGTAPAYSIAGGADAALFAIDASTGALTFLAAPDFEAPGDAGGDNVYDVVVAAGDGSFTDSQALSISIGNADELPVFTSSGNVVRAENADATYMIVAVDPDGSGPIAYGISGGADASDFWIDPTSGALTYIGIPDHEAPADSDGDNVYEILVSASDGTGTSSQTVYFTISDVNEAPRIVSNGGGTSASVTIAEGQTAIATIAAADGEGSPVAYAITGGPDADRFVIDAVTGVLSLIQAPDYEAPVDAFQDNFYTVIVSASDGELSSWQTVQVLVANVNEGISITSGGAFSIVENSRSITSVTALDLDGTAPIYAIAGGADASLFAIDSATGALSFISAPDYEAPADAGGNNVYDVVVAASDGIFTDTKALTVTVGNARDAAPVIAIYGDSVSWNIPENLTYLIDFDATDTDGDPITYSLSGPDAALFAVNSATGALSWVSPQDFEAWGDSGFHPFHVNLIAGDGALSDTLAITITIANVNEGVTITSAGGGSSAAFSVAENSLAVTSIAAVDADRTAVTYSIAGGADASRFTIDPATGALSFLAAPNFEAPSDAGGNNVYDVVVAASDGNFTDTQAVAVSVTNVNEGVTITSGGGGSSASLSVAENGLAVTNVVAVDSDGTPVTWSIAGGADAARFTIDSATGALRFGSAPNFEVRNDVGANNVYDVIVAATDGVFIDTQALAVTVTNVNEAVTINSGGGGASASVSIAENSLAVTSVSASDADGQAVTYAIAGGADAARFTIDAATGALRFVTAPNHEAPSDAGANNVYDVIVSASDGSFTDTQSLAVTVTNVREGNTIV
ncbi:MAG TPA: cadherin domain-containing protein, partial [Allosphingosinicella sp.]|nr:cadherin domain-containing protein [Allosphingosinicella sp.]